MYFQKCSCNFFVDVRRRPGRGAYQYTIFKRVHLFWIKWISSAHLPHGPWVPIIQQLVSIRYLTTFWPDKTYFRKDFSQSVPISWVNPKMKIGSGTFSDQCWNLKWSIDPIHNASLQYRVFTDERLQVEDFNIQFLNPYGTGPYLPSDGAVPSVRLRLCKFWS